MRALLLAAALIALAAPTTASAQVYVGDCENLGTSAVTSKGPYGALPQEIVEIPSSLDGRPLQIGIVRPDAPEGYRAPVIVHASSYHDRDLKEADIPTCASFLVKNYVQHGYAVALVPTRGTADTDGCPNLFGKVERSDLDDALNWLGTRPWSNGRIAMYGVSYSGSTPWVAAATGNRFLKTIIPASGVNDLFDLALGAGTLDWRFWFFVSGYYHYYGPVFNNPVASGRDPVRTVNSVTTCPDHEAGQRAQVESALTGVRDAAGYWAERALRPMVERKYRGSVLLINGLKDWNVRPAHTIPWAVSLRRKGIPVHELLGQWGHATPDLYAATHTRWDWADTMLRWLDRRLKRDRTVVLGPRVQVEDSAGRWRYAHSWPLRNRDTLFLTADGGLKPQASNQPTAAMLAADSRARYYYTGDGFPQETTSDDLPIPAEVDELCVTCAAFRTRADRQLRISGLPEVRVNVTPTLPTGYVTAFLYRRDAEGLHRLGFGSTDLRFPRGENSGDQHPLQVVPGKALPIRIELEPLEAVVPAGNELVLILGQGRSSQLPGSAPAPVQLSYGDETSRLRLRFTDPPADRFFTPPGPDGRQLGR